MFKGGEVLMPEDIGLFLVTLFSLNWSLEIGQYDVLSGVVGLFTIVLFLIIFLIAFSMKLKWHLQNDSSE